MKEGFNNAFYQEDRGNMFSNRLENYFDNLSFHIEVRHCFIFLKYKILRMFLNNLNFISVSTHKAKVYKKFSFLEFTVESPKNKFHSSHLPSAGSHPINLLENFPGTRAFLSYWSPWLGWKRKVRLAVEFSGLFL